MGSGGHAPCEKKETEVWKKPFSCTSRHIEYILSTMNIDMLDYGGQGACPLEQNWNWRSKRSSYRAHLIFNKESNMYKSSKEYIMIIFTIHTTHIVSEVYVLFEDNCLVWLSCLKYYYWTLFFHCFFSWKCFRTKLPENII